MSTGMEIVLPTVRAHEAVLAPRIAELDKWSGGGEASGEALVRYTMAELAANDDLRSCTPTSLYLALLSCAVTRLVPGKLKGYSFLVPFGNTRKGPNGEDVKVQEATFMMGWKGVKHIGYRADLHLVSAVIHENDAFDYDVGTTRFVKYRPALKASGPVIGAAAWVELPRGRLEVEYLPLDTLNKIKEAANARRKSPAWNGPFADQMQRKSALKRLGKQIEMGEEFLKADAIEVAQDEDGSPSRALDEFTDGAATKMLAAQSTEAATFGHLPRPTQVQVPAGAAQFADQPATKDSPPAAKLDAAKDKARAADKARPTPAAGASKPSPTSSASTSAPAAGNAQQKATGSSSPSQASPSPAAGTASPAASPATPAASSQPASTTAAAPAASAGTSASSSESSASAQPDQLPSQNADESDQHADEGDTSFDTSFFGDATEDPVDTVPAQQDEWPTTRAGALAAFVSWAEQHNNKADAIAGWETFRRLFDIWLGAVTAKTDMDEDKTTWTNWSTRIFTVGRRAVPAKGITAIPPDEQIVEMQKKFAERYKDLP
jgi:phage RecT family recombinase